MPSGEKMAMCGMPFTPKNLFFSVPAGSSASEYLKSAGLSFCFLRPAVKALFEADPAKA